MVSGDGVPQVCYDPNDAKVPRAVRQRCLERLIEKNEKRARLSKQRRVGDSIEEGALLEEEERAWASAASIGEEMDLYNTCGGKMAYMNLSKQYLKRCWQEMEAEERDGSKRASSSEPSATSGETRDDATRSSPGSKKSDVDEEVKIDVGDPIPTVEPVGKTTCLVAQQEFWLPFLVSEKHSGHLRNNIWSWEGRGRSGTVGNHSTPGSRTGTLNKSENGVVPFAAVPDPSGPEDVPKEGIESKELVEKDVEGNSNAFVEKGTKQVFLDDLDRFLKLKMDAFVSSGRITGESSSRILDRARAKVLLAEARQSGPLRLSAKERIYDLLVRYVEREGR